MPPIRNLTSPNDRFGPPTAVRARLSRTGNGAALIVRGNPFSFKLTSLGACLPFLNLSGHRTAASARARQTLLDNNGDASSITLPGAMAPGAPAGATPAPSNNGSTAAAASNGPSPVPQAPPGGPFAYIPASKTGHY